MSLKSGHRVTAVTGEESTKQFQDFEGNRVGTIKLQPDGWFFTLPFIEYGDKYYDFKFRPSDIVVMTYPKCGTTWTQEIIWTLIMNPNLDNPEALAPVNFRCPFLEADCLFKNSSLPPLEEGNDIYDMFVKALPGKDPNDGIFLQLSELAKDPRIIKTHLPFSLLPPSLMDTCKVVYVARNPKDVAVSYCHHSRLFKGHNFVKEIDTFVEHFVNDTVIYSPYWKHIEEGWNNRHHPNLHFAYYEEMKENPKDEIKRLHDFLGLHLTDEQINTVVEYTSFSSMQARPETVIGKAINDESITNLKVLEKDGGFFRKGKSGDYRSKLSLDLIKRIDEWTETCTKSFGDDFKYKL